MSPTSHDQPAPASAVDDLASRWFPLIPRVKPICRPLPDRVARVRHLAHLARQPPGGSLTRAAEAHNLAALIASDCGLPDLARSLCWRQFDTFCQAGPFEAETGKLALQPLVNLGRLHIRDGEGSSAYQLLEALFTAVKSRDQTVIEDRTVDLRSVIVDVREHRDVVRWLWSVLLADGTRALARAGRWAQALHHAQQHKGIGQRLLDGRQVAILAAHDRDAALGLLAATRTPTPWEKAVAACLEVLCRASAGRETTTAVATMVNRYVALEPGPAQAAFHARLGLCAIGLAHSAGQAEPAKAATARVVNQAVATTDAYIAWQVSTHLPPDTRIAEPDRLALMERVEASGLHRATMPAGMKDDLMASVRISEQAINDSLAAATLAGRVG